MAQEQEQELTPLGTFVLAEMGRAAVIVGDIRDVESHIGKTVTVHADGETFRVKLARQWESTRNGGRFFDLYRETGESKRDGTPKRTRTGYKVGGAFPATEPKYEPMSFADAMLYLNASHDAGAGDAAPAESKSTRDTASKSKSTADTAASVPTLAEMIAANIAAGMSPADAASTATATLTALTAAPAESKSTASKSKSTRGKSTASTRGKSTRGKSKSTASASNVDDMLADL